MAAVAGNLLILTSLIGVVMGNTCTKLDPTRITFYATFPGEFFGSPTIPTDCTNSTVLSCSTDPLTLNRLTDGEYGDGSDTVDSSQFIAWNGVSRITPTRAAGADALNSVRTVNLFFYHDPALGIGLPEFILSGSTSETIPGAPLPYTILGNQDLGAGDAQVRNVTLALTQSIVGDANRFHLAFSLMSGVQQFALSEIELCSDIAQVAAEALSVRLNSEPIQLVNGSTVLIPANRTGVGEDAVVRLSCTVVNQGRFTWVWTLPDSVSSTTQQDILDGQLILDGTRTSIIEVPRNRDSVGNYTCTASYATGTGLPASSVAEDLTIDVELVLYPRERTVNFEDNDFVLLECILAGEISGTEEIGWNFNGQMLSNSEKHNILDSNNVVCAYGTCQQSQLQIRQASDNDAGTYTCSYPGHSNVMITLMNLTPSPSVDTSKIRNTPTATTEPNTTNWVPIGAGAAGAVLVCLIVIVAVLIFVICCCTRRSAMKTAQFSHSTGNAYSDDESDALYQVIPKKEIPPPLPSRPPPGSYATVDSKNNGHIELANITSGPTLRDSIISMPAELGGPSSDHTLAKLSVAANGQGLNLRNNPLYSSADNLITHAPPLPDKRFTSTPGILEEDNQLDIYAVPNKPPPLPERMMTSPEPQEASPDPIYTEAGLSPAKFQRQSPSLSPSQFQAPSPSSTESPSGSSKFCPYASIYADPKPLHREEGPMEVRPYHIKEIRPLGTGQFGEVMLAETLGLSHSDLRLGESTNKSVSIQVAVKRLKQNADKVVKEAFEKEIKFMARLNHMNVIRMLAICPTGQPFILMEYMEFGDLNQYLQKYEVALGDSVLAANQITVSSLLYACVQIANGMRYLASLHFIHRDIATRNFLVGKDHAIKIADFGMSRSLYSSHYYRIQGRAVLPIRWMANECFYGRFSEKTDVWAFGVAMWEVFMLAKVQPFDEMTDQEVIDNAVNTEKLKVLQRPVHCPEEVYELMLQCWEKDPEKRINFEDVYSSLAALHSYSDL